MGREPLFVGYSLDADGASVAESKKLPADTVLNRLDLAAPRGILALVDDNGNKVVDGAGKEVLDLEGGADTALPLLAGLLRMRAAKNIRVDRLVRKVENHDDLLVPPEGVIELLVRAGRDGSHFCVMDG